MEDRVTRIEPTAGPFEGTARVPGDKSISHRAVLFSAMAEGTSYVAGVLDSDDVRSSMRAVEQLGAQVDLAKMPDGSLEGTVSGWDANGPCQPSEPIDCGNSGTTARLLMGILAPWDREVVLTGDASLRTRPMRRVSTPLIRMGARFLPEGCATLPLTVCGTSELQGIAYDSPVASAQVKSAVLLAGVRAHGTTRVTEPAPSRDHSELMLPLYGVDVAAAPCKAEVQGPSAMHACHRINVPGDPSSAAFLACAAALVPGSDISIENVSLNPARIGFVRVLESMGACVRCVANPDAQGEVFGTISVRYEEGLHACEVPAQWIASLVDEVPILSLVAARAQGVTVFRGIEELRVKETDRVAAIIDGMTRAGVKAWAEGDDLFVEGNPALEMPDNAVFSSGGDHRLAMTWALAGITAGKPVFVQDFESVSVSYPDFLKDVYALGGLSVQ